MNITPEDIEMATNIVWFLAGICIIRLVLLPMWSYYSGKRGAQKNTGE